MRLLSRRRVLGELLGIGAVTAMPELIAVAESHPTPDIHFPTNPRERIAVSSWSFRDYITNPRNANTPPRNPRMDLKDFGQYVADNFHVRNIEPYYLHFRSIEPDYLAELRESLLRGNSHPVNIAIGHRISFYDRDASVRRRAVDYVKQWVDVAGSIGSPSIRTNLPKASNSALNVPLTVDSLRRVVEYAAKKNIVVNLENDDVVDEDAFLLVKIIDSIDSPYLRALPDFANSMMTGNAAFNYRAVEALFHRAYCICHAKDFDAGENGQRFSIDLQRTFQIVKSAGYRGFFSIEYSGLKDPYAPTQKLIERCVRYLS